MYVSRFARVGITRRREYRQDLKWTVGLIQFATLIVEKELAPDRSDVSGRIRQLLDKHLNVTGIWTVVKLRHIMDPDLWTDLPAKEVRHATMSSGFAPMCRRGSTRTPRSCSGACAGG